MTGTVHTHAQRVYFWDRIRSLVVFLVLVHHGACAYSRLVPWWYAHTGLSSGGYDLLVLTLDLFIMPALFFVSGYFAWSSLQRRDLWGFVRAKSRRLLLPMVFLTIFYVPVINFIRHLAWSGERGAAFFPYWVRYVASFTPFCWHEQDATTYVNDMSPNYLWYLGLLYLFMLVLALLRTLAARGRGGDREVPAQRSGVMLGLWCGAGLLIALGMAWSNLFLPAERWVLVSSLLTFQPVRLPLYAGCFFLGVHASRRNWFVRGPLPGALWIWACGFVLGELLLLLLVKKVIAPPSTFGVALLAASARTACSLCMIALLTGIGYRYWRRASAWGSFLAHSSYDVYLLHLPLLVAMQYGLRFTGLGMNAQFLCGVAVTGALCVAASRAVRGRPLWQKASAMLALFPVLCLAV